MTVALSGVGGDELFAGYPFFQQYLRLQSIRGWGLLPQAATRLLTETWSRGETRGRKGRMKQLLTSASPSIEHCYPIFRQILSPVLLKQLTTLANGSQETVTEKALRERREHIKRLPLLSQVSVAEYLGYTQHTLLKDTDQMSMAASLEVREPFFDPDLAQFVLSVPDKLKKGNYPKKLLIESLKPL